MSAPPPGRYHVALRIGRSAVLDGWWDDPDIADRKYEGIRAEHEDTADAQVALTEWHAGQEWPLREWPPPA